MKSNLPFHEESQIEHVDANEHKLCEITKHPIGIVIVYIQAIVGFIFALGLTYFLLPTVIEDVDTAFLYANLFAAVSIVFAIIIILLATMVYRRNRLIVTDRNITQILQYGLI
jgi:heme/copper-type cytochrome/quinol oxidase subunit 1